MSKNKKMMWHSYSQISWDNLLACVGSIDCTNLDVIDGLDRDKITGEKLQEMYNLLSPKWLKLDEEYAMLMTTNKRLSEKNEKINAYYQKLEQILQLTITTRITYLNKKVCNYFSMLGHACSRCIRRFKDLKIGKSITKPKFVNDRRLIKYKHLWVVKKAVVKAFTTYLSMRASASSNWCLDSDCSDT